jgi:type IV pilus assembly protein PilP
MASRTLKRRDIKHTAHRLWRLAVIAATVLPLSATTIPLRAGAADLFPSPFPAQINPGQQISVPAPAMTSPPGQAGAGALPAPTNGAVTVPPDQDVDGNYTYNPSGRRDPFAAIVLEGPKGDNLSVPPLQRAALTELSLIAILWGGFGYTAMVQTPDGKGYTVRQGTKIGPNNGVVSAITENTLVVQERYTDVYGKKQVREYVKLLHPKENTE